MVILAADVTRDGARRAAHDELSKHVYHQHDPSLLERAVRAVGHFLSTLLQRASDASPGGTAGLLVLVVLVALAVVAVRLRVGPLARSARSPGPLLAGRPATAAEHRRRAEELASRGEWAAAVREAMRAVARRLEEAGVLDPRPGRTADELAADAGAAVPALAGALRDAALLFDEVWYGGRPATADSYRQVADLVDRLGKPALRL